MDGVVEIAEAHRAVSFQDRTTGGPQAGPPEWTCIWVDRIERFVVDREWAPSFGSRVDGPELHSEAVELVEELHALVRECEQLLVDHHQLGEGVVSVSVDAKPDGGGEARPATVGREPATRNRRVGRVPWDRHAALHRSGRRGRQT
jgi:hypothetical protein